MNCSENASAAQYGDCVGKLADTGTPFNTYFLLFVGLVLIGLGLYVAWLSKKNEDNSELPGGRVEGS